MQASSSTKNFPYLVNDVTLNSKYGNCRCCLSVGQHTRIIGEALLQILKENLSVILNPNPRLPLFICVKCSNALNIVQAFRQKVLASEEALIRIVGVAQDTCNKDPLSTTGETTIKNEVDDDLFNQDELSSTYTGLKTNIIKWKETSQLESLQKLDLPKLKTEHAFEVPLLQNRQPHESTAGAYSVKIESEPEQIEAAKLSPAHIKEVVTQSLKKRKRKKCTENNVADNSEVTYIRVGEKDEIANEATKIRANIAMLLQNSTATAFRRTKSDAFQCLYCENKYGIFGKLKLHTANDHQTDKSERKIFDYLRKSYKFTVHADITDLKCKICQKTVGSMEDLAQHLKEHEIIVHDVKEESKVPSYGVLAYKVDMEGFICHICLTSFRFLKFLVNHMQDHYAMHSCSECVKKFLTQEKLQKHLKEHSQKETKCTDCHLTFGTRSEMLKHRYSKHFYNKYKTSVVKCPVCPKTFSISKPLERFLHMESEHNIKRPEYTCEFCNKSCKTIHSLIAHKRRMHFKGDKLVCDICGYSSIDRTSMKKHADHHKGTRNFECDICHKKFRTKGNLRLHMRGHFNDKRFACSLCDAAFIQKHCLKSHMKSRHPDSGIDVNQL